MLIIFREQGIRPVGVSGSHDSSDTKFPAATWSPLCKCTETPNTIASGLTTTIEFTYPVLKEYFTFTKWQDRNFVRYQI